MTRETVFQKIMSQRAVLLILFATAAVFAGSVRNGFVWDDAKLLMNNEVYRTFDLKGIFLSKANGLEYLPVRDLTLALDARIWGMDPFGFHLTNLALYLAGVAIVFRSVRILADLSGEGQGEFLAFWSALIFAVHPLHGEAVNFIAARNNLLAGVFLFLSFNFCIKAFLGKKNSFILLSAVFFVLSAFSKASVMFYPFFLAVVFAFLRSQEFPGRKKLMVLLLFFVVDLIAVLVHFSIASETGMMNEAFIRYGTDNKAFLFARAVQIPFFYFRMLVLPYPLSVLYSVPFLSGGFVLRTVVAVIASAAIVYAAWLFRKQHPLPFFAVAWYFLSLVPVLNIFPTEPVVADRYAYFAVLGFALLCACLLKVLAGRRRAFLFAACGIIVLWSVIDLSRTRDWHDDLSLWEAAAAADPDLTQVELANALWAKGRYADALGHLREEYGKNGTFHYLQFMGKYFFLAGRYSDAAFFFRKALAGGGDASKELHLEIALSYEKSGMMMPALEHYLKALEIKESSPRGRTERAAREGAERIRGFFLPKLNDLRLRAVNEPMNSEGHAALALYLQTVGMYNEAELSYLKTVELNPSRWELWYNLGLTEMKLGKYGEAIRTFERSLAIRPRNTEALNNIGISYMALRQYGKAAYYYRKALEIDPGYFYGAFNLGRLYFITGDGQQAGEYFSLARRLAQGNSDVETLIGQYLSQMR